jgi:hypothetical protein
MALYVTEPVINVTSGQTGDINTIAEHTNETATNNDVDATDKLLKKMHFKGIADWKGLIKTNSISR